MTRKTNNTSSLTVFGYGSQCPSMGRCDSCPKLHMTQVTAAMLQGSPQLCCADTLLILEAYIIRHTVPQSRPKAIKGRAR